MSLEAEWESWRWGGDLALSQVLVSGSRVGSWVGRVGRARVSAEEERHLAVAHEQAASGVAPGEWKGMEQRVCWHGGERSCTDGLASGREAVIQVVGGRCR